jgi:hypothetical protein
MADGKLYVLLDIDDTLLKNIKDSDMSRVPNIDRFDKAVNIPGKTLVLRPHLQQFMDYLFDNHYVSLWTWSDHAYAMRVANVLTGNNPKKFKDILSEEDADISSTIHNVHGKDLNYLWYDYNAKYIKLDTFNKLCSRNNNIRKINDEREAEGKEPLNEKLKVPFTGYAPCNTILIDDADYNVNNSNRNNLIQIKPFGGHTTTKKTAGVVPTFDDTDTELLKIIETLEQLKAKNVCKNVSEEQPIMKAGRRTRRHKRHVKKTRKVRRKL